VGCAAGDAAAKGDSASAATDEAADAKRQLANIPLPELQFCALAKDVLPPSSLGGASPTCVSRFTFTPSGIEPKRIDGRLAVVLKFAPADLERLSDFLKPLVKRSAVLLRDGVVLNNYMIVDDRVTELLVVFGTESETDNFLRALFAE
jgi:hypothetical protein